MASELNRKPTLSWSAISQYTTCGRQYWHARIARSPTGPKNSTLLEGTCGHAALEYFYRTKRDTKVLSNDEVIVFFKDYWATAVKLEEAVWDKGTPAVQCEKIEISLRHHLKTIAPTVDPLLVEHGWRITLPECSHDVIGVVDLVATDLTLHDHKFVARLPQQANIDDPAYWVFGGYGAQLTCYALARAEGAFGPLDNWEDVPLYLDVNVKGSIAKQFPTRRSRADIVWFRRALVDIARAIEAQVYFPHPANCNFCDFRKICRGEV